MLNEAISGVSRKMRFSAKLISHAILNRHQVWTAKWKLLCVCVSLCPLCSCCEGKRMAAQQTAKTPDNCGWLVHTKLHKAYRPWGPPSLLNNAYRIWFSGVKRPERGVKHPTPPSAEVKERVELHLYSPSGPSWTVPGQTFTAVTTYRDPARTVQ
jgi:hypothetical protein